MSVYILPHLGCLLDELSTGLDGTLCGSCQSLFSRYRLYTGVHLVQGPEPVVAATSAADGALTASAS
ncbi:hypothetical protein KC330_g190 [Hortaea werneckii]|nr:hypothetical protein KC330_g190 [Hortaea werneckii]